MTSRAHRRPRQGILPFVVRYGNREDVTARGGLPLVVEALRAVRLDEVIDKQLHVARRTRGFSELEKVEALVLLIAAGGDRVEDIRMLSADQGLTRLLNRTLPSPDALLDFLNGFDDPTVWERRPGDELSWVPPATMPLEELAAVNRVLVGRAAKRETTTATIDHDGTIIESHKREAQVAYEGTRGYQPLVAVWAEENLVVADEFRDGNVPGGKDPLSSVKQAFAALPPWVQKRYFRADSADYYTPLLQYLVEEQIVFSVSADMSPELRGCCTKVPEEEWEEFEVRTREVVHVAEVEFIPGDWPKKASPLRYVALRFTPLQQEMFDGRGPKYLAVVTNRPRPEDDEHCPDAMTAAEVVKWHWGKAGTIEQVHRVLKDELAAGVLPSQRFGANAAWFRINVLTYNLLTLLKRHALPERYRVARPKRLRFELFTLAGRLTTHQSQLMVDISAEPDRAEEIVAARQALLQMRRRLAIPHTAS
jgi:hypothetical protein